MSEQASNPSSAPLTSNMPMIVYILFIASYLLGGIPALIGVALAHANSGVADPLQRAHYSYQIRTFWWGLLWIVICTVLTFLFIISIILAILYWLPFTVLFIWYLYRVIKGWLKLNDGLAIA